MISSGDFAYARSVRSASLTDSRPANWSAGTTAPSRSVITCRVSSEASCTGSRASVSASLPSFTAATRSVVVPGHRLTSNRPCDPLGEQR